MKTLRFIAMLVLLIVSVSTAVAQIPSPDNRQIDNTDNGFWQGQYFNHQYAAGPPTMTRNDSIIAFNWGQGSPDGRIPNDFFSAKWTRNFNVPVRSGYRFELEADDGARVWVDGKMIIDNWWKTPLLPTSVDLTLEPGDHNIEVTYHEQTGNAQIRFQFFPRGELSAETWLTEYFNSPWVFTNPVFVHKEREIYHDWSYNAPAPNVNADNFGVRMQRLIEVPPASFGEYETYRFTVRADDGVRIYVDDQLLIDGWTGQAWNPISADIDLYPGTHTVRLEYYDALGYAFLEVNYYKINEPAQAERSNPMRMLNHIGEVVVKDGKITSAPGRNFPLKSGQGVPGELFHHKVCTTGQSGSTAPGSSQTGNGGMHGDASMSVPAVPPPNPRYEYCAYKDATGSGVDLIDRWHNNHWAGRYPIGFGRFVTDITISGEYMYVAWTDDTFHGAHSCRGQVDIINVADPANPFRIAVIDEPGYAHSVFIKEGVLYVLWGCSSGEWARNTSQLRMYDLDPFQPLQIGQYQLLLPEEYIPFNLRITESWGYVWIPYDDNKWAVFR